VKVAEGRRVEGVEEAEDEEGVGRKLEAADETEGEGRLGREEDIACDEGEGRAVGETRDAGEVVKEKAELTLLLLLLVVVVVLLAVEAAGRDEKRSMKRTSSEEVSCWPLNSANSFEEDEDVMRGFCVVEEAAEVVDEEERVEIEEADEEVEETDRAEAEEDEKVVVEVDEEEEGKRAIAESTPAIMCEIKSC